ncbi:MAG: GTP cyclohydrolase MptA [Candidatus Heimdallarchaeota archaeon]
MNQFKKDLQDSISTVNIPIDKVGIVGVEKKVDIIQENKRFSFYPKISALISLPSHKRGIHMSRTSETIEEIINEVIFKPTPSVEVVGDRIARELLEKHPYTEKVEVKLEGKIIVQVKDNEQRTIQKAYNIVSFVKARKNDKEEIDFSYYIGANAVGMTVCPCAKEMSQEYAEEIIKNRNDINLPTEVIQKLLNILPFSSHNQRSTGTIIVQIKDLNNHRIDVLDIIDIIEDSMSGKMQSVLKRPEEAKLVRSAHLKPLFAEDVVREMAKNFILRDFPNLDDNFKVIFKIESYESIHPHNVYAELKTTIGELKKQVDIQD